MRLEYRPEIDGLRALAVAAVVVFHAFPSVLSGGFVGVDVFFVISGYLITRILAGEAAQTGRISLVDFYARRARRILPALLVVLACVLVFGWFALLASEYKILGRHSYATALFIYNFRLMSEVGYFDQAADLKPLLHLWSLAVEEQFYLIWPLLMMAALRWRRRMAGIAPVFAGVFVALSFGYCVVATLLDWQGVYYNPLARAWQLGIGAWLALAELEGNSFGGRVLAWLRAPKIRWAGEAIGGAMVIGACVWLDRSTLYPGWAALLPSVGAVLLMACAGAGQGGVGRVLAWRPFVALGLISYPLYLWHWPILSFMRVMENGAGGVPEAWIIGGVAAAVVLATLTYWAVEHPVRRRPARSVAGCLVLGLVLVFAAGQVIKERDGFPEREALAASAAMMEQAQRAPERDEACVSRVATDSDQKRSVFDYCLEQLPENAKGRVILTGDSHAHALFAGLADSLGEAGYGVTLYANSSCPPFPATTLGLTQAARQDCTHRIAAIWAAIEADTTVDTIIIATRGPVYFDGIGFGEAERDTKRIPIMAEGSEGVKGGADVFFDGLGAMSARLQAKGKRVLYVLQVPEIGVDMNSCVVRPMRLSERPIHCAVARRDYEARMGTYRQRVFDLAIDLAVAGAFYVIDPEPLFCDAAQCGATDAQGRLLYSDNNHMSRQGGRLIGAALVDALDIAPSGR